MRNLRHFAQLDEAEYQLCDLGEGLDSALALLKSRLPAGIEIQRDYGDIAPTYCAAAQINQVFMNVLKNAVEACDQDWHIALRIWSQNGEARVCIADDGPGISPERLQRIFDFGFGQSDGRVRMGSGLAMAYRIVEAHGGHIEIDSKVGAGTQVEISLPQSADTAPEQQEKN